jgi:hypothetical protein
MSTNTKQLLASIQKIAKVHNTEVTAKKIDKILKDGFDGLHVISGKLFWFKYILNIFCIFINF